MRPCGNPHSGLYSVTNAFWPNVVLKKAPMLFIMDEARMQHAVRCNYAAGAGIVPVVGLVRSEEVPEGKSEPDVYMALPKEGPSLEDVMMTQGFSRWAILVQQTSSWPTSTHRHPLYPSKAREPAAACGLTAAQWRHAAVVLLCCGNADVAHSSLHVGCMS